MSYTPEIKVMDCTLRDGGLVNDFFFTDEFVKDLYEANLKSGVDYMEFGYRASKEMFDVKKFGKWKFCDDKDIRAVVGDNKTDMKISVMADVGRCDFKKDILNKKDSPVDLIRVATYINTIPAAIEMIEDCTKKGYEVNSLGTEWDLYLSKPYRDNPQVLNNWEFAGMKSAVHVDGTLNNPKDTDKSWSVEVFIPWSSIYQVARGKEKPVPGEHIRTNFSRVEWTTDIRDGKYVKVPIKGEDKIREYNWVWAPTGVINIHMPEYWGFVQISDKVAGTGETPFVTDPNDEVKWLLRNLYYRQNEYAATFGEYAPSVTALKPEELCPAEQAKQIKLFNTPSMYEITLPGTDGNVWHIRQDGLVWTSKK